MRKVYSSINVQKNLKSHPFDYFSISRHIARIIAGTFRLALLEGIF